MSYAAFFKAAQSVEKPEIQENWISGFSTDCLSDRKLSTFYQRIVLVFQQTETA